MRTPSFGNLQSLPAMVEGKLIADTIASMGSMDFVLGDVGPVMTFSPELEQRIPKLLSSYPPGRQRSALIPMLMYCQDEVGHVSEELMQEVCQAPRAVTRCRWTK